MIQGHVYHKPVFQLFLCFIVALSAIVVFASDKRPMPPLAESGTENQMGLVFSPDGMTAYWAAWDGAWGRDADSQRRILVSRQQNGTWTSPEPVAFSGDYSDDDPFVSPDGEWLYFVSDRPRSAGAAAADTNIWRFNLGDGERLQWLTINSEAAEYSPVVTAAGTLYFASSRNSDPANGDLYSAAPEGGEFAAAIPLGLALNSPAGEWNLWVSSDESEMIFEASARATNISVSGDLYYSWQSASGWTPAVPLTDLNTDGSDLMPRLHPDGETLYFTSATMGNHTVLRSADWAALRERLRADFTFGTPTT